MKPDISKIPLEELQRDLEDNETEIRILEEQLSWGRTHYKNGDSITMWLGRGKETSTVIRAEIERRNVRNR